MKRKLKEQFDRLEFSSVDPIRRVNVSARVFRALDKESSFIKRGKACVKMDASWAAMGRTARMSYKDEVIH